VVCTICNESHYIDVEKDGILYKKPCSCYKREMKTNLALYRLHLAGLNDLDILYNINSYEGSNSLDSISTIKKYVNSFASNSKNINLFFYGKASCQKTTVSKWMIKEIANSGFSCKYLLMNNLLNDIIISSRFKDDKSEFEEILNCDFLVIDESFAKERVTVFKSGYQLSYIDQFLRERLETLKKATVFISNYTIAEIQSQGFNTYIQEIIFRNCYTLEFKDVYKKNLIRNNLDSILG